MRAAEGSGVVGASSIEPIELVRCVLAPNAARPRGDVFENARWAARLSALEQLDALSLCCAALRRVGALGSIPPEPRMRLTRAHALRTAQSLELCHEAERLLAAFVEARIAVVPLKGIALHRLGVHRDFGARSTSDIDLLTCRHDRQQVTSVLENAGYHQTAMGGVKHLPAFVRGDLIVEVHEAAYWTVNDWRSIGLAEMIAPEGGPRLDRTIAHLLHHAFEGSAPTPALTLKTLSDVQEIAVHVASRPEQADAIAITAGNDGLRGHLSRVALAIELATGQQGPSSWTQGAVRAEAEQLIGSCAPATEAEIEAGRLKHRFRALWRQPVRMKAALLRSILLPSRAGMEQMYGLPTGSPLVWPAYGVRTAQLAVRAATDAWRLVRGRIREDRRDLR